MVFPNDPTRLTAALAARLPAAPYVLPSLDMLRMITIPTLCCVASGLLVLCLSWVLLAVLFSQGKPRIAPVHGLRWWFEPAFVLQMRFISNARSIISSGYAKYGESPFTVRRYDVDIMILPHKYLSELRLVPPSKLSGVKAQIRNLVHRWTNTTLMMESDLHFRVLQNKLTAELPKFLDIAKAEAEYAWCLDVPQNDTWTEVDIQDTLRVLVARMTSRIFLGLPNCRNETWLNLAINFPLDTFTTAFTLRRFPPWLHPFIAFLIPARYRMRRKIQRALKVVSPLLDQYKRCHKGETGKSHSLLEWMVEHGNEKEIQPLEMTTRQCILTLASIHTTSMTVSNVLFDLCEYPEWFPILQDEIAEVTRDLGEVGVNVGTKEYISRLEKLDSFIIECQRFNPPILLAPQRVAMTPLTLRDGTHIPEGTRISWAASAHLNDPKVTENPQVFDPMRSYRRRYSDLAERNKHLAGQTSVDNLTFGYGKLACPGRSFAVGETKLLLAKLLGDFDFKFPAGKSRPSNMYADENVFPDPRARIMMRKKDLRARCT